jgi:hypothetical protein
MKLVQQFAETIQPVLNFPIVRRTRRNHGLEHATVHLLSSRIRGLKIAGRSTDGGFILIGNVSTDEVKRAVHDALERMRRGEHSLAVHPNCGTNLVTTGTLTTLAGVISLRTDRKPLSADRIGWAVSLMTLAVLVSQPLGMDLQRHITTKGDPGDLDVVHVARREIRVPFRSQPVVIHQVITRRG